MNVARVLLLALLLYGSVRMTTEAATSANLMQCTAPEHRQFDFWIGEWEVFAGPQGDRPVGSNRIERSENGCWLVEHWRGASGNHGTSTNAWDAQYSVWRQFWIGPARRTALAGAHRRYRPVFRRRQGTQLSHPPCRKKSVRIYQ